MLRARCAIVWLALAALPALPQTAAVTDDKGRAASLMTEGGALLGQKTPESLHKASAAFQEALSFWQKVGDAPKQIEALLDLAAVHFYLHETNETSTLLHQAEDLARATGNGAGEGMALSGLAVLHDSLGDEPKAIDELARSRIIFQKQGDKLNELQALSLQLGIYQKMQDAPRTMESYEQTLPLYRALNNRKGEALTLMRLAQMNNQLQKREGFERAVGLFTQAMPLFQADADSFNEAYAWWGLATAHDRLSHPDQARDAYLKALPILTTLKDVHAQGLVLVDLGEDEYALGNSQKAIDYFERALPLLTDRDILSKSNAEMRMGTAREALGQPEKALQAYRAALVFERSSGDTAGEATAYLKIGGVQFGSGQRQAAMDAYAEAMKISQAIGNKGGHGAALMGMTTVFVSRGEYQKALETSLQALSLVQDDAIVVRRAAALSSVGNSYSALHESKKALDYLNQSLALQEQQSAGRAGVLTDLGEVYSGMGDQKTALRLESEALEILRSLGNRVAENKVRSGIGLIYSAMGDKPRAMEALKQGLQSARERKDIQQQSAGLNNLAQLHQAFGDYKEAEKLFGESLVLVRQVGDRSQEATTLASLGMLCHSLGEEQRAVNTLTEAISISHGLEDRRSEAVTLNGLALVFSDTGEPQKALETYNQVLAVFRDLGDPPDEAVTLSNLGSTYRTLGASDRADRYYHQALEMQEQLEDVDGQAVTLNNLGVLAQYTGEPSKALTYYGQSLKLAEKLGNRPAQARLLSSMGIAYSDRGDRGLAVEKLELSLRIARETGDVDSEALALHNLGTVRDKLGDAEQALDQFRRAIVLWRQIRSVEGEAKTLYTMAKLESKQGHPEAALGHVEESIRLSESLRSRLGSEELRASYLATAGGSYELEIGILMQLDRQYKGRGYDAKALETSERARARSLLDLLTESRADIRHGVDSNLLSQQRSIERSLNAKASERRKLTASPEGRAEFERLEREIEDLTTEYDRIQDRIRIKSPAYATLTQPQPLTLRQIQREVLDKDTLLLEYSLGQDHSYLWAVTPTSFSTYELPARAEIEGAARDFHELVASHSKNVQALHDVASELSATLLGPVVSKLGSKRLMIVGDGSLQAYVPFQALPAPPPSHSQPLIADHEVVNEPSASAVAALRREVSGRKLPRKTIAVLADPVFERDDARLLQAIGRPAAANSAPEQAGLLAAEHDIPRLPHTREEARGILALTTPAQSLARLDFSASKAAAENPELADYRVVHFATHGYLDPDHPELSGLVLSLYNEKGQPVDGFLRLNEIFNLKLPVPLVVLSACESGQGKLVGGEGLVGLTRGFMYAGAASLAVSLWSVNDAATAELMTRFYRGLLGREHLRPAAALRAAQLFMMNDSKWRHPYYWAPFVVEGEWR